ncbi:hypothetical protein [Achromobacter marplatensis]
MLAGGLMACATGLIAAPALDDQTVAKSGASSLSRLRLPDGARHALLADRLWLYGYPAEVLVFDAPMKVPDLIRHLSGQQPGLVDLNVLPGQLVLSGTIGGEQWVVQMQDVGSGRTAGSISTLRFLAASQASGRELPVPPWLPEGSRLRLDFSVTDEGVRVTERIWQHVFTPARMMSVVDARLLQNGWRRQAADGMAQAWARGSHRLRISVVPLDSGSGLRVRGWAS